MNRPMSFSGYPQPPIITYFSNNSFCFTIPDNPISPEVYEITLTDSTGSLIRLSGVYSTSRCLIITSDLYPNVCGPFQLSVAAVNEVGREVTQLSSSNITEPTPCECYQQKSKKNVDHEVRILCSLLVQESMKLR